MEKYLGVITINFKKSAFSSTETMEGIEIFLMLQLFGLRKTQISPNLP
jgi:hypothetical protein